MRFLTGKRLQMLGVLLGLVAMAGAPVNAADGGKGMAYVSNQDGGVTVIDLDTMEVVGEFDTGAGAPRGIGVTADGKLLITANRDGENISLINRVSGKLIRNIHIGENPEFVRIRGNLAFVSFEPASVGGPPPRPGSPEERALREAREREQPDAARIAVVDLKKGEVIQQIVGGMETEGIEFSADGKKIIVTNEDDQNVTVHDIETGRLLKTIDTKEFGMRPRGVKMAPDGKSYVVTIEYGNKLVVLNEKFDVVKSVPTGEVPYGVTFDRKGERLFIALARGNALQVLDAKTFETIKMVPIGQRCWHFTFTPDDSQILVACGRSHDIHVLDAKKLEPVKRIKGKELPWGIVTYPKSVGSLDWPD